jgi:hypothetical protein
VIRDPGTTAKYSQATSAPMSRDVSHPILRNERFPGPIRRNGLARQLKQWATKGSPKRTSKKCVGLLQCSSH